MKKYAFPIMVTLSICMYSLALITYGARENKIYVMPGQYYANETVITDDGNIWGYQSKMPDATFVDVVFDDNGTENYIYDDIIVGLIKQNL